MPEGTQAPFTAPDYDQVPNGYSYPVWGFGMSVLQTPGADLPITEAGGACVVGSPWTVAKVKALADVLAHTVGPGATAVAAPQAGIPLRVFIIKTIEILGSYPATTPLIVSSTSLPLPPGSIASNDTIGSYQFFINPTITLATDGTADSNNWFPPNEGCLSFPDYQPDGEEYLVDNGTSVAAARANFTSQSNTNSPLATVRYMQYTFNWYTLSADNTEIIARSMVVTGTSDINWIVQHETDHTNGLLFADFNSDASETDPRYRTRAVINPVPNNDTLLDNIGEGNIAVNNPYWVVCPGEAVSGKTQMPASTAAGSLV